ncbi:nucleoside triphosphate pyrophosphohydrolase [Sporosalibacterium faouarense]|uniref:nucleoside triphosphate pyrophosphohydrolase n=1 Tax=Sporosalibacterium faouarense TaxID=516123 RepID=UPI00192C32CA|nr:nucleoside triphosphate pyrophosphohydrolase [Sporosalibacterium faouarense]
MKKITVIGLGPGNIGDLTLKAVDKLKSGLPVYLRTKEHPATKYLIDNNIHFESFDYIYEHGNTMDEVYNEIVESLLKYAEEFGHINYCVPGNPILGEKTITTLNRLKEQGEISIEIITGMSFIESVISTIEKDVIDGLKLIDGLDFKEASLDINSANIITHVYKPEIASEVKLKLVERYGDEYEVYVIRAAGIEGEERIHKIPIYEVDRIEWVDHLTSIYVPKCDKINKKLYDMYNLIDIMEKLRSKEGCKWDIKQNHQSLREYIVEEAYEVVDAIDDEDYDLLSEELGDVLLQVVFHSQIASEEGYFSIWDVVRNISEKLIYRHPHVFGDEEARDDKEAVDSWNSMKDKEKSVANYTEKLKNITKNLPSLLKSYKIQDKVADVGFDWPNVQGAMSKVEEELIEVKEVYEGDDTERREEELGDLLFAVVNICRFANVNPEIALNKTINKFINRFSYIESESKKLKKDLKNMTLEEMDVLWEKSKIHNYGKF